MVHQALEFWPERHVRSKIVEVLVFASQQARIVISGDCLPQVIERFALSTHTRQRASPVVEGVWVVGPELQGTVEVCQGILVALQIPSCPQDRLRLFASTG
jgi:hypothetical protein